MTMRKVIYICKCCLAIVFALISIYLVAICVFSNYISEVVFAKALPLSVVLVAISILFFSMGHKNGD